MNYQTVKLLRDAGFKSYIDNADWQWENTDVDGHKIMEKDWPKYEGWYTERYAPRGKDVEEWLELNKTDE